MTLITDDEGSKQRHDEQVEEDSNCKGRVVVTVPNETLRYYAVTIADKPERLIPISSRSILVLCQTMATRSRT
nr:hypothetical protein CFP56_37176 [Quercus suber]